MPYRFVIFQPEAKEAHIVGSFTGWRTVPMRKVGGYWQITLPLQAGEHRFSYLIDGRQQVTDPTLPVREPDDFGGENSILEVQPT
jgi:1,4-alpha-glucan branching enzyme